MKTKKLICAFLLVALSVFYIGYAILTFIADLPGEKVASHKQEIQVVVEDGVIADAVDYIPFLVPKAGNYQMNLSFQASDFGFYTYAVIKDASGMPALFTGLNAADDFEQTVNLAEGRATIELHYLRTVQELRDYCKDIPIYSEKELSNFENTYPSDTLNDSGTWYASFSIDLYEKVSLPLFVKWIILLTCLVPLVFLFVLFFKDHPTEEDDQKTRLVSVSICYAIFIFAIFVCEIYASAILTRFFPSVKTGANMALFSIIFTILLIDIGGLALIYFTTKKIPANPPEKKPFGVGKFLLYLMMTAFLTVVGSLIGALVQKCFPDSTSTNISQILANVSPTLRIFSVAIIAPIVEELIFRKFMIDRLLKHGEFLAIFLSGLTFGLFHGNFRQFFSAAFLGWLWAYVYVRTGNIRNTIFLHAAMNMSTGFLTLWLYEKVEQTGFLSLADDTEAAAQAMMDNPMGLLYLFLLAGWFLLLVIATIVGLIVFIVRCAQKKFPLQHFENEPTKRAALAAAFANPYFWLFLIPLLGEFVIVYLPGVLG